MFTLLAFVVLQQASQSFVALDCSWFVAERAQDAAAGTATCCLYPDGSVRHGNVRHTRLECGAGMLSEKMSRDRHSSFNDRTRRSAKALRFGLRGQLEWPDLAGLHGPPEQRTEFPIAIVQQIAAVKAAGSVHCNSWIACQNSSP